MGKDYKKLLQEFQEFEARRKLQKVFTEKKKPPAVTPGAQGSSFYRGGLDVV